MSPRKKKKQSLLQGWKARKITELSKDIKRKSDGRNENERWRIIYRLSQFLDHGDGNLSKNHAKCNKAVLVLMS